MGRDEIADVEIMLEQIFQSTRPVWGATCRSSAAWSSCAHFNPRPVWGATDIKCARLMVLPISIHAPRVGRDHYCATAREYYAISIHAPRVGRDLRKRDFRDIVSAISIHAPRVGRDDEEGEESNV